MIRGKNGFRIVGSLFLICPTILKSSTVVRFIVMLGAQVTQMSKRDDRPRAYLSQSDVPAHDLDQALRIAQAIADNYGKNPTRPLRVAQAMSMQPGSSRFRMLCGASIAYGLTDGGYNADQISISGLGRRIVAPTTEGDDIAARREALLRPRIVREFLTRYNESKLPSEPIGRNVLEELGVPSDRAGDVFRLIVEGAKSVGFLRDLKGHLYVDLEATELQEPEPSNETTDDSAIVEEDTERSDEQPGISMPPIRRNSRVFITHGKNKDIVVQLKELLTFGSFTPVVAIEQETAAKSVPDKVLDDMRSCAAAIIHVGSEKRVLDPDGAEHTLINQNVLIEIGAALALYGRKFILLVEKGVKLPSNLQGLYEVRYEGDKLDYESTMRLLKAFNDFRS